MAAIGTPELRAQEQRGDLGVAGVIRAQKQRIDGAMQVELLGRVRQGAHAVVIERHFTPDLPLDGAAAGQMPALLVFQHEEVETLVHRGLLVERARRGGDLVRQKLAVVGKGGEADPGLPGQRLEFVQVPFHDRSHAHYSSPSS